MFSHENDPESAKVARKVELEEMRKWIHEYSQKFDNCDNFEIK